MALRVKIPVTKPGYLSSNVQSEDQFPKLTLSLHSYTIARALPPNK